MTRRSRYLIFALIACAIIAAAVFHIKRPKPVPVIAATVDRGRVTASVANTRAGTVKACRRAKLAPPVGGRVSRLPVREGDRVKGGEILLELWNDDLAAQVRVSESEAAAAHTAVEEACVMAAQSRRESDRTATLKDKGLATDEASERARANADASDSRCRAARERSKTADAAVDVARASLERTILRAPFDGRIADVTSELGEFVTPSPPGISTLPAVDLIDDSCLYISAPIDEVDAPAVGTGMDVTITLDSIPGRAFAGRVRLIMPYVLELEKQARTVDVEADFLNQADTNGLLPGYSADMEITLSARDNVVRVPTEAVLEGGRVLVLRADGLIEERKIASGISNWKSTEVISGVAEGDRIITSLDRKDVKPGAYGVAETPSASAK